MELSPGTEEVAINGSIIGGTTGSVLFVGPGSTIAEDNANFFWNDTTNRLGLGTNAPTARLQVSTAVASDGIYLMGTSSATNHSFRLINDAGVFTNMFTVRSGGGSDAGKFFLQTNGTTAMVIDTAQRVGIGTTSPAYALDVQPAGTNSLFAFKRSSYSGGALTLTQSAANTWELLNNSSSNGSITIDNTSAGNLDIFLSPSGGTVGIGTSTPNANAILDVSTTTKAFMPPRMTTTQKNAIASPTSGMVVYDSTLNKLCVYGAASWETITSI